MDLGTVDISAQRDGDGGAGFGGDTSNGGAAAGIDLGQVEATAGLSGVEMTFTAHDAAVLGGLAATIASMAASGASGFSIGLALAGAGLLDWGTSTNAIATALSDLALDFARANAVAAQDPANLQAATFAAASEALFAAADPTTLNNAGGAYWAQTYAALSCGNY